MHGANGSTEIDMANRDVLAIGASAGGVEALFFLAQRSLPTFQHRFFVLACPDCGGVMWELMKPT